MPKRKLIPDDYSDRRLLIGTELLFVLLGTALLTWGLHDRDFVVTLAFLIGTMLGVWVLIYFIQELPEDELGQYTIMIADIEVIGAKLNQLVSFLEQERERVLQSQATLRTLEDEKTRLEPVVITQRQAVNAILSAYTKGTASRIWKERAIGFVIGLLASLIAGLAMKAGH